MMHFYGSHVFFSFTITNDALFGDMFLLNIGKVSPDKLVPDLTAPLPKMTSLRNNLEGLKEHSPKCDPVAVRKRSLRDSRHNIICIKRHNGGSLAFHFSNHHCGCVEEKLSVRGHPDQNMSSYLLISFHKENADLRLRILEGTSI